MNGLPQVGATIRVVVPNFSATRTNPTLFPDEPETLEFTGTVLKPYKWLKPGEFCLSNDNAQVPVRIINMKYVVSIDGSNVAPTKSNIRYVDVKGKSGNTYHIVISGNDATCTCPGFLYRKHCSHIDAALGKKTEDVPAMKTKKPAPKSKHESKLDTCRKLLDKNKSRAENIQMFVDGAGLTSAGASTYYQKLKNEHSGSR